MVWYSQISFSPDIPPSIFFVDKGGNLGREEGHPPFIPNRGSTQNIIL
jgi:hypothetical protein